jgi:hypothetical protein
MNRGQMVCGKILILGRVNSISFIHSFFLFTCSVQGGCSRAPGNAEDSLKSDASAWVLLHAFALTEFRRQGSEETKGKKSVASVENVSEPRSALVSFLVQILTLHEFGFCTSLYRDKFHHSGDLAYQI